MCDGTTRSRRRSLHMDGPTSGRLMCGSYASSSCCRRTGTPQTRNKVGSKLEELLLSRDPLDSPPNLRQLFPCSNHNLEDERRIYVWLEMWRAERPGRPAVVWEAASDS